MMFQNRHSRRVLAMVTVLILAGCSKMGVKDQLAVDKKIDAALAEAAEPMAEKPITDVPPDVARALLPAPGLSPMTQPAMIPEERFDISAMQVPAAEFFATLVKGTDYNIVIDPMMSGEITLNMNKVTLEEALKAVRETYGYEYRRIGKNYMVSMPKLQTRMFKIDYINMQRTGKSTTHVASSGLAEGETGVDLDTESVDKFWVTLKNTLIALLGLEVRIYTQGQNTTTRDELAAVVGVSGRAVGINPQAGAVIVRGLPKDLRLVEEFLGQTQESVVRQVILEAKILEVRLNEGYQSGINWASLLRAGGWSLGLAQVGGGAVLGGSALSEIAGNSVPVAPGQKFDSSGTITSSAFGGVFAASLTKGDQFSSFIELLKQQGDVHVLSSPRISTMNNQKAVIKVGEDEYFVTNVTGGGQSTVDGITTRSRPALELLPFFSGIALDVTPQIDSNNNVLLHVHPTISEITQAEKIVDLGADGTWTLPTAASSVRESDSVVRASSGQVVVIGGLMQERSIGKDASTPGLGDLPGVGGLFRHERQATTKSELVILIKPTVVENGMAWNAMAQQARDRLHQMRRKVQEP